MKYLPFALLLILGTTTTVAAECASGDFTLNVRGYCNYTALLLSFETWFADEANVASDCDSTAEDELLRLLNVTGDTAGSEVHSLCGAAFDNYDKVPFEDSTGKDKRFIEEYYKGNTDWNEQVATLFPENEGNDEFTRKGKESMLLKRDAHAVDEFHDAGGRHSLLGLPDLPNFENCEMNAAYCCWPKDRQDDNDGSCDKPYDYDCVDSNPGDNTDLCFVEHAAGANATGYNTTEGWFSFPFDDGNKNFQSEGPIHCHGFAWAEDENDPSFVYRGNNLFFVSLYDHMYVRGYVENIPSAPMCACAEQMPTVTRSDCTQIEFEGDGDDQEHKFLFTFRDNTFTAELVELFIDFNACEGIDEDGDTENNDLWSYMNRLFIEDKVGADKLQALTQKLVGDKNCDIAQRRHLADRDLIRGHTDLDDEWIVLGGRGALHEDMFYGKEAFNYLVETNSTEPIILKRGCAACYFDHQWLYYKRVTQIPSDLDLWYHLRNGRDEAVGNVYGVDFLIYSSYEDALNDENAWSCPEYRYRDGFPGNCGPEGTTRRSQGGLFNSRDAKNDVKWFAQNKGKELHALTAREEDVQPRSSVTAFSSLVTTLIGPINNIPGQAYTEDSGNTLIISASGRDIYNEEDSFRFAYESTSGDLTMSVRVKSIDYREHWTKAGLMVRDSLDAGAKHFSVMLTGKKDAQITWRPETDERSYGKGHKNNQEHESIWLKLTKRNDVFSGFKSFDGVEWISVDEPRTIVMNATELKVGLAVTSHHTWKQTEATFDSFESDNFYFPSSAPSASPAPSFAHESLDIGRYDSRYPGSVDLQGTKYIVKATGADIWGGEDGFTFINHQVAGDFVMTAHVKSIVAAHSWTKFGLMARDSLDSKAKHVTALIAPNQGTMMHVRKVAGDRSHNSRRFRGKPQNMWLRLEREGDVLTGYRSIVGGTADDCEWHVIYQYTKNDFEFDNDVLEIGIAVSSHQWRAYSTVEFDHFSIVQSTNTTGVGRRGLRGNGI
eukprot:CAMPEP_0119010630 /NCGR_PEP_ID=MMETSP1176-20130426/5139_1 /TAXON_ID=265551 /ORGANISM="Synedropsis recta cf, Strain CCMP1620" /LENGTH=1000 /DNA_ID=CAMNT_0006963329 /DNA_START=157 /DNA_END=3159 /DNA_ORIENTATION=+